jgi:hypothetical protein
MNSAAISTASRNVPPRWVTFFAEMRFLSFSLLLHSILLVVLGTAVLYQSAEKPPDFTSSGDAGLLADTSTFEPPADVPLEAPKISTPSNAASSPTIALSVDVLTTGAANRAFAIASVPISARMEGLGTGAGELGKGMGGGGVGAGMGGNGMRFFGTKASGQNVVLVVDVSGSMIHSKGKSPKTYRELEKEVSRVIREFDLKSRFGLVVFSGEAKSFRTHLVNSTTEEKDRAIAWLKKNSPEILDDPNADQERRAFHHGTRADLGLQEAFNLIPDVILFVSDGEPSGVKPHEVLATVEAAQKTLPRPAPIHSVAYLADDGQRFMKELAEKNSGTFREVNPRDIQ